MHHVLDLRGTTDFVIGRAIVNAYLILALVANELVSKVKRPKDENVKRLARITADAMKTFHESGTGEDKYVIIPKLMFEILTQTQMVTKSSSQIGKFVRGVILENRADFGTTQDEIDAYLKSISSENIWYQVKPLRAEYVKSAAERVKKRKEKRESQRLYRGRKQNEKAEAKSETPPCVPILPASAKAGDHTGKA